MTTGFQIFFLVCIIILAVLVFFCLIRAIKGPKIADRIMASNMSGTLIVAIILLMAVYLNESYIIDVALVYAVISFLAVIVITKIYVGLYREQKEKEEQTRLHKQLREQRRQERKRRRARQSSQPLRQLPKPDQAEEDQTIGQLPNPDQAEEDQLIGQLPKPDQAEEDQTKQ